MLAVLLCPCVTSWHWSAYCGGVFAPRAHRTLFLRRVHPERPDFYPAAALCLDFNFWNRGIWRFHFPMVCEDQLVACDLGLGMVFWGC